MSCVRAETPKRLGSSEAAMAEFEEIMTAAELAPRYFRSAQRDWISQAKSGAKRLAG